MKRLFLLFLSVTFSLLNAHAQQAVYMMEQFSDASFYFNNGTYADARVNYDLITGQVQYFQNGELMEVPDDNNITRISFKNGRNFFQREPNKFYEKMQLDNGEIFVHWKLKEVTVGSKGAYGSTTQAQVIGVRVTSLLGGGVNVDPDHPVYQKDVNVQKCDNTYIVTVNGKEQRIKNIKNVYKAFSSKQDAIKAYVAENKLTMTTAEEAFKILNYAMGL